MQQGSGASAEDEMEKGGAGRFYVYRIFDGLQTLYVGKGHGRRLKQQMRRFRCEGEIIEHCASDDEAFKAECRWIAELRPTENRNSGGGGGRVKPKRVPAWIRRAEREFEELKADMEKIGPRRYVAQFLLRRLTKANISALGVSEETFLNLQAVAHGEWR